MDNRLTGRRLSDFLAYEWIVTLVAVIAAIIVWELIYSVSAVRLSAGQQFKIYYDEDLYVYETGGDIYSLLDYRADRNGKTFSYDVLSVGLENLTSQYNVLSVRLSVQEGDVIFTSSYEEEGKAVRAKTLADAYTFYNFERLLTDAKEYLKPLLKDGETDVSDFDNFDLAKIDDLFNTRMMRDNRYRTEEQKADGRLLERGRIEKLVSETADFERLLNLDNEDLFFRYTKYEQSVAFSSPTDYSAADYARGYDREVEEGRGNAVYGLNLAALTHPAGMQDKYDASAFFKLAGNTDAEDVVLMAFDFKSYQPHLQFETISFINTIVRSFSDFLD